MHSVIFRSQQLTGSFWCFSGMAIKSTMSRRREAEKRDSWNQDLGPGVESIGVDDCINIGIA